MPAIALFSLKELYLPADWKFKGKMHTILKVGRHSFEKNLIFFLTTMVKYAILISKTTLSFVKSGYKKVKTD